MKELFAKLGTEYEKTNAELVLTILRRQVVETTARRARRAAAAVDQVRLARAARRSSREPEPIATAILDAIFSDPRRSADALRAAADAPSRDRARLALRAHDYVYDVFESAEGVAA